MKIVKIYCDLCKKEEKPVGKSKREFFGHSLTLDFKGAASLKREIFFNDLCPECTEELWKVLKLKIKELTKES